MKRLIRRMASGMMAGVCSLALAMGPVPRQAEPFTISMSAGKKLDVGAYKGKVVLLQFLFTTCGHCQLAAETYAKLQRELGPAGLQVVGVAFNDEAVGAPALVEEFQAKHGVNFPVGTASRTAVMNYLGVSAMEMLRVPQIVIIGRDGVVRVQSETKGSEELQQEAHVRTVLQGLLRKR